MYRLQQHIGLTRAEGRVLLTLSFLFLTGLSASYLQGLAATVPAGVYAETEAGSGAPGSGPVAPADDVVPADTVKVRPRRTAPAATAPDATPQARMNLNTATASQLERLPRIGPRMAARIVAYRAEHGAFQRVEDLVRVRGIGPKTLARLSPYLFVAQEP